jgi:Tol biopolymer transport system component
VVKPKQKLIKALPKEVSWPEWSPDGNWIAFVTDNLLAIAEVETTGATGVWFQQYSEPVCQKIEKWSPSGDRILFYTKVKDNKPGEICVASINQGKFVEIVNLSMMPGWDATWSPDGDWVAFISRDQRQRRVNQIFVMDTFTGQVDQITFTNYDHFDTHWK